MNRLKTQFLLSLTILLTHFYAFAQDTTVTYYDSKWQETTEDSYTYYGKLFQNESGIWVKQDYYKSGQMQMLGHYTSKEQDTVHGKLIYFKENGDTSSIKYYLSDSLPARLVEFYDNGNPSVRTFIVNKVQHGYTIYYHSNGEISSEGVFQHGNRIGDWKYYDNTGNFISSETFVSDFETTCGYNISFPNDRWIYNSAETRGKIIQKTSMDLFIRKGVRDSKGNEQVFAVYTACLHDIDNPRVTAADVANVFLKNKKVKYKKVTSYNGIDFSFDGVIYFYTDTDFSKKVNCLLFMTRVEDNVMELIFHFEKKVDPEILKEIKTITDSIEW